MMAAPERDETTMPCGFSSLLDEVISADLCCACGTCAGVCAQGIIRFNGVDCVPHVANPEECLECGACVEVCPGRHVPYADLLQRRPAVGEPSHFGPHLSRFRAAATDADLRGRGASGGFVIGLFCGVNLDPCTTLHILDELGVTDLSQVASYGSRSANYGATRVVLRDGRTLQYPDHDSYGFDVVRLAPLFQRVRCSLCFDNVNELADVSVGDAGNKDSYVVVRTSEALSLVRAAEKASRLSLSDVSPDRHRENVFKKKRRA